MSAFNVPVSRAAYPSVGAGGRFPAPTPTPKELAALLDGLDLPRTVDHAPRGRGRPRKDRSAIVRSLVARALLDVPTLAMLVRMLRRDTGLRLACGWRSPDEVPSSSTFCRLLPEILDQLPEQLRSQMAHYYPDNIFRKPTILSNDAPAPELEQALHELPRLRDVFVTLSQQGQGDLSLRQLGTMLTCYLADGPQPIRGLQQQLGLGDAALKRTLDRLESLRFTRATRDRSSRRRYLVHRTRRATEFLDRLFASIRRRRAVHDVVVQPVQQPTNPASTASGRRERPDVHTA